MNYSVIYGRYKKCSPSVDSVKIKINSGLTEADVLLSRKKYGKNKLTEKKKKGFFGCLISNLTDPIIRVLIMAVAVNIIFTFKDINLIEVGGILLTVTVSALVSTISEYSGGRACDNFFSEKETADFFAVRDGNIVKLKSEDIVKYDIICISPGLIIPADGVIVYGSVTVDQSSLTGESVPITKFASRGITDYDSSFSLSDPFFICKGSPVISGDGRMLVTAVGDNTMYGAIASELQSDNDKSPLKLRLEALAKTVSRLGYIGAGIVAAVYLVSSLILGGNGSLSGLGDRLCDIKLIASELIHALTLAVSIVVVAVPEGLPMMITVVLSANMKKMMKMGVLVRRLVGIETAGCLSMLFTDKTGTVTSGNMEVSSVLTPYGYFGSFSEISDERLRHCMCLGQLSCHASNATDRAVDGFIGKYSHTAEVIDSIPFDSSRKYAAALLKLSGTQTVILKGATEYILPHCDSMIFGDLSVPLKIQPLPQDKSMRLIAMAVGDGDDYGKIKSGIIPDGLTFVCIYVIRDEIRHGVREAVRDCQNAGIQVVMLTGDSEETATSVANKAGILKGGGSLSAEEIHKMSDGELSEALKNTTVISRVTPTDKSRLVRVAKDMGMVVGMTGDGVNDAPALKNADVGFAMGSGTEVAREAGDIVITDDNFVSISKAVLFGRTIFESIRKFILFQLTMNVCAVGISILGPLFGVETPITITQMLWINIIMDTLGSLAFAGETPKMSYMRMKPRKRGEKIISRAIALRIFLSGVYILSLCTAFLAIPEVKLFFGGGDTYFLTVFFALFVFCGIAVSFCSRTERINILSGLRGNKPFIAIMVFVCVVQLLMIYFGGAVFRTVPLTANSLIYAATAALSVFPADCIIKMFLKRGKR